MSSNSSTFDDITNDASEAMNTIIEDSEVPEDQMGEDWEEEALPKGVDLCPGRDSQQSERDPQGKEPRMFTINLDVRRTAEEKAEVLVALCQAILRRNSFKQILQCLRSGKTKQSRVYYKDVEDFALDVTIHKEDLTEFAKKKWERLHLEKGLPILKHNLAMELQALVKEPCYGKYKADDPAAVTDVLSQCESVIHSKAPTWIDLFRVALPPRTGAEDEPTVRLNRKIVVILSMLCGSYARNLSNYISTAFALYLNSLGLSRRGLETFNKIGICVGYDTLRKIYTALADRGRLEVRAIGGLDTAVWTYDNFEYRDSVREETTGNLRAFRSITNALVVEGREMPAGGLKQAMFDQKARLSVGKMIRTMKDPIRKEVQRFNILEAVKAAVPYVDSTDWKAIQSPPQEDVLPNIRTRLTLTEPIMISEDEIVNNIAILKELCDQVGLEPDNEVFAQRIILVFGDLKTLHRLLTLMATGQQTAQLPFDQYKWVMPSPGLWHLKLNYLKMIHHQFWGRRVDHFSLSHAAGSLHRSRVDKGNDFQALEALVIQSYQARIISMAIRCAGRERQTAHEIKTWIEGVDERTWSILIDQVHSKIHSKNYFGYEPPNPSPAAPDVGLLVRALRECCILFQAKASGKGMYAKELIRLLHIVDGASCDAAAPELRRALLGSCLINLRGKATSNFEMDRGLELKNGNFREQLKNHTSSSQSSDDMLKEYALTAAPIAKVRLGVEAAFGHLSSNRHQARNISGDIMSLAAELIQGSITVNPAITPRYAPDSVDLMLDGMEELQKNVALFHRKNTLFYSYDELDGIVAAYEADEGERINLTGLNLEKEGSAEEAEEAEDAMAKDLDEITAAM